MKRGGRPRTRKLFVITGISGAGKSQALKCFEDFGFFCVDNLPIAMLGHFADLLEKSGHLRRVALCMDIREGKFLRHLSRALHALRHKGFEYRILFLDAADGVVMQRFSETRHRHPLGTNIPSAIQQERKILTEIKALADKVIDTSQMTLGELKETLSQALELKRTREMSLSVVSFGFKYGVPMDADIVMDVRFMPNPNYVPRLKPKNGLDAAVQRYALDQPASRDFLAKYCALIRSLLPRYIHEGKSYLTIAIGCTGGRHRSVCVTRYLAREFQKGGYAVREFHRDMQR